MKIRSLHGEIIFSAQTFKNKTLNEYKNYFDFTNQFQDDYISERLKEYSLWLSLDNSYEKIAEVLFRNTGEHILSDQKISQLVISKAKEISISEEKKNERPEIEKVAFKVNRKIDLYDKDSKEILLLEDGILVRGQKEHRKKEEEKTVNLKAKKIWRETDACMLECADGHFRYIIGGMEFQKDKQSLPNTVKRTIYEEYGETFEELNIVSITDGATTIRRDLLIVFGVVIIIILDWYHLTKKMKELMSMIAKNKEEKQLHLNYIRKHCWEGEVDKAIIYLKTTVIAKNELKLKELIGYLEKHKDEIINYKKRKLIGKCIGSGRMECGVNQIVGRRQKNKGMSWSEKGNKALAILQVQKLNNTWDEMWEFNKVA